MTDGPSAAAPSAAPSYRLHGDGRQIVRPAAAGGDGRDDDGSSEAPSLLLFSNDRIRVSDFRLRPSQSAACEHGHPTVRWQVAHHGEAEHRVTIAAADDDADADGEGSRRSTPGDAVVVADRRVFFVEGGTTWEITNTSRETIYRQIVFEFLSDEPRHAEDEIRRMFAAAEYSTDVGTELLFENELCRCWDFYLDPSEGGGAESVHHHCLDYVFVNVAPSRLIGLHPESLSLEDPLFDSVSEDNQVTWNSVPRDACDDATFAHGGKNGYDDRPMREYLIELK